MEFKPLEKSPTKPVPATRVSSRPKAKVLPLLALRFLYGCNQSGHHTSSAGPRRG